jgi:hypothetical protein
MESISCSRDALQFNDTGEITKLLEVHARPREVAI